MAKENYIIQAVDECLDIFLLLCAPEFRPHTEQEIVSILGLGANKVFRMLRTLEHKKLVKKSGGRWMAAPEIVKISDGFRRHVARKRAELEALEQEYTEE